MANKSGAVHHGGAYRVKHSFSERPFLLAFFVIFATVAFQR